MKKALLSIAAATVLTLSAMTFSASAADGIKIDKTNFPDKFFREYVSTKFDKNNTVFCLRMR